VRPPAPPRAARGARSAPSAGRACTHQLGGVLMANVCQAGNGPRSPAAADHQRLAGTEAGGHSGQLPRVKSRREPQAFPSHTMPWQHSYSYASAYKYSYCHRGLQRDAAR
jgi:hypothetical protein